MNLKQSTQTAVTLANAGELVRVIAQGVVGNEVADTFNGSPLTRGILYNLAQTRFQAAVAPFLNARSV